jgi:hypothetical protein
MRNAWKLLLLDTQQLKAVCAISAVYTLFMHTLEFSGKVVAGGEILDA